MSNQFPLAGYGFETPEGICSFAFGLFFLLVFDFAIYKLVKKVWVWVITAVLETSITVSLAFGMWYLALVSTVILIFLGIVVTIVNQNEIRTCVEKINWKADLKDLLPRKNKKKVEPEYIFDREKVYGEIFKAVINMSQEKRGALITVMRKDDILDPSKIGTVIKQRGVDLNSPIKAELLETIFYEGTRLHDGAVVIKDDKIARAAVFFQSTRQALTGKYGSRHQAALGISENSDSVTIVVSEETGRIAIAFQGELTSVNPDTLMRVFMEDMSSETVISDDLSNNK